MKKKKLQHTMSATGEECKTCNFATVKYGKIHKSSTLHYSPQRDNGPSVDGPLHTGVIQKTQV